MSSFKRVWTDMHIHIHIYIYFSTPGIQKMGKLPHFDMFFLKLLESNKWENWLVLVMTCFFSNSWNPKNGKIISCGVDMFFSNSWESKKWGKLISFGVDTFFFSNFWCWHVFLKLVQIKKLGNWLVLVLTDWNLEPSAYTRIEGKIWKCKVAPKNNVFFQKGLNRHAYIYIYI